MVIVVIVLVAVFTALVGFVLGTEFTMVITWSPTPDWEWNPKNPDGMQWDDGKWRLVVRRLRDVEWDLENGVMTASLRPNPSSRKASSAELESAL